MTHDEVEYHAHTPTGPRSGERPLLKLWNRRPGSGARAFCRHWHAERTICTPPVSLSPRSSPARNWRPARPQLNYKAEFSIAAAI